jgi:hypothetical protein
MLPESYDRASFDGGPDDPRVLVRHYQQRVRWELLLKAAEQASRPSWWSRCLMTIRKATRLSGTPVRLTLAVNSDSAPTLSR